MDVPRWDRIQALFADALAAGPDARATFLAEACPDAALRQEVEELLDAHEADGPMDVLGAAWAPAADVLDVPEDAPLAGRRVGPYRLLRRLGRGGMGEVFLAERADGQFEREVALKLLRDGLDSDAFRRRFLQERQTLARLEHPGIARLLDGGLTDDGRPYFAMEAVQGERLDRYCDARRLDLRQRLTLFLQVCHAVHHAHQRLVVHRDLKPSNILVTPPGTGPTVAGDGASGAGVSRGASGAPRVKLLDFGIARLLEETETSTRTATRLLTPEYAAPEQLAGGEISTATDIYGLGVMLYELLAGRRPWAVEAMAPGEIVEAVCHAEPPRPSTAAATANDAEAVSAARATDPDALARRLQGDLDTICLKALDADPARRYASAEALADDVERHLAGVPVRARPATAGYRASKFVTRHRAGVVAAAVALLALVGGLAGTAWQARVATQERDRAQAEAVKAEEALDLLVGLFEQADPSQAAGEDLTAREVLERAEARLAGYDGPAPVEATLLDALGRVYQRLGLFGRARPLLDRALALRRADPTTPPEDLATSLYRLGLFHHENGDYDRADTLLVDALALHRAALGDAHPTTLATEHALGQTLSLTGRMDHARPLLEHALAGRRAHFDATHEDVQASTNELALLLHRSGNMAAAESLFAQAVQHSEGLADRTHPAVLENLQNLARMRHRFRRDYAGADPLYRDALAMARTLYGDDHPGVAVAHNDLAVFYDDRDEPGDLDRAEGHARAALAIWMAQFGPAHRETAIARVTLGNVLQAQGRLGEAEATQREALAALRSLFGEAHMSTLSSRLRLADVLAERGTPSSRAEADRLYRAALATSRTQFGEDHAFTAISLQSLGHLRLASGTPTDAERLYRQALGVRQRLYPGGHWSIDAARSSVAASLTAQGRYAQAERLLLPSLAALDAHDGRSSATRRARERLAALYDAWGRPSDAARYR